MSNYFRRRVAEDALGTLVPTSNGAVHVLADNGVIGRLDNRCKKTGRLLGLALFGHVPKYQHDAGEVPFLVSDRCRAVINTPLGAVFANQDGVVCQSDDSTFLQCPHGRVLDRLAGLFVDDPENSFERFPSGILFLPSGQGLGHRV